MTWPIRSLKVFRLTLKFFPTCIRLRLEVAKMMDKVWLESRIGIGRSFSATPTNVPISRQVRFRLSTTFSVSLRAA